MIAVRVDGNSKIGMGHLQRCFAISYAIEELGEKVLFLTAEKETQKLIICRGFECEVLNSKWDNLESEIESLKALLEQYQIKKLLLDTYYITETYLQALNACVKIAYIDDLNLIKWQYDLLINYSVYAKQIRYEGIQNQLIGCEYVPLRKEYMNVPPKESKKRLENILVLTGGADPFGFGKGFWREFRKWRAKEKQLRDVKITIVCGKYNKDYMELKKEEHDSQLEVLYDVKNMRELMLETDLAVSAGGVTLYELTSCGIPTISYSFVDNQLDNVKGFQQVQLIPWLGDLRESFEWEKLFQTIICIEEDYAYRKSVSIKMQKLIDGKGAVRIAQAMLELAEE